MCRMALMVLVALAACGPSASEIRAARTSEYTAPPDWMLDAAIQAAQQDYKVGDVDAGHLRFETVPRFYSVEGDLQSPGAGGYVHVLDKSVKVSFVVQVVEAEDHHAVVTVTPHAFQVLAGSPEMRPLPADDPNLPPWVHGRADALAMSIYKLAKKYAVPAAAKP